MTRKKKKTLKKSKSVESPTESSLKVFISFAALGVVLTAYAHTNFSTKSEVAEMKVDHKSDMTEIKGYLKDFNTKLYDLHKVYYPHKEKKK